VIYFAVLGGGAGVVGPCGVGRPGVRLAECLAVRGASAWGGTRR